MLCPSQHENLTKEENNNDDDDDDDDDDHNNSFTSSDESGEIVRLDNLEEEESGFLQDSDSDDDSASLPTNKLNLLALEHLPHQQEDWIEDGNTKHSKVIRTALFGMG